MPAPLRFIKIKSIPLFDIYVLFFAYFEESY